jgi:hypothetical protein
MALRLANRHSTAICTKATFAFDVPENLSQGKLMPTVSLAFLGLTLRFWTMVCLGPRISQRMMDKLWPLT